MPESAPQTQWQYLLKTAVTDPQQLLQLLELSPELLPAARRAERLFPLRVPRSFIARMKKADLNDPLLQQVLPVAAEADEVNGYILDPLQEQAANPLPGLLHKYQGRVLLVVAPSCVINCRYCFRRHFPYSDNIPGKAGWDKVLAYIANDLSLQEVILSGGDPLLANDHTLDNLTQQIAAIAHVKTLRIHSRLPIVLPQRVTPILVNWLTSSRLRPVMVVHCNHAQEINADVAQAIALLQQAGVMVLNQAVLLKNINDSVKALRDLSHALFDLSILPYYLHLLDKVQGAAHLEVEEAKAKSLYWQLRQQLPGYLVPTLVREQAGATAKLPVF